MPTFNWHELPDEDLRRWLIPHLLTLARTEAENDKVMELLKEATEGFTKVDIQVAVNGVPIPNGGEFILAINKQMDTLINDRARELIQERAGDIFDGLQEIVDDATRAITTRVGVSRQEY